MTCTPVLVENRMRDYLLDGTETSNSKICNIEYFSLKSLA